MPRRNENYEVEEDEKQVIKSPVKQVESQPEEKVQIVTENQLLNAKLDHVIAILEREFKE